jgi:hypothetical protein
MKYAIVRFSREDGVALPDLGDFLALRYLEGGASGAGGAGSDGERAVVEVAASGNGL